MERMLRACFFVIATLQGLLGLACGGGADDPLNIFGSKPVISSFTANPSSISPGQSSELRWSVSDATSLRIDPTLGDVSGSSSRSVSPSSTTTYTLTATNISGSTTASATVTVQSSGTAPVITQHPQNQTVNVGQTASFSVSASGTAPLSYQWRKNGSNIGGATSASFSTPATTTGDNGSQFSVQVSNAYGSVTSNNAILTVQSVSQPDFSLNLGSTSIQAGNSGSTSVSVNRINGHSSAISLSLASNAQGITGSGMISAGANSGNLNLQVPASVTANTYALTVNGSDGSLTRQASLSLTVTGGGSSSQLLLNPGFESGAQSWTQENTYIITNDTGGFAHGGSWYAWMGAYTDPHNDYLYQPVTIPANATSANLSCWLLIANSSSAPPPASPTNIFTVKLRSSSGTDLQTLATLSNADAASDYKLRGPWDLSAYKGQTVQVYFASTQPTAGRTTFLLDDAALNVTTGGGTAPIITQHPQNQTVNAGQTASFSVTATGTAPLSYLWRKNGSSIGGATSSSYTTPVTTTADNGSQFSVQVSNSMGSVTSNNALLTVQAVSQPDFSISLATPSPIQAGNSGNATVNVSRTNGHSAAIALSLTSNSQGIAGSGTIAASASSGTLSIQVPTSVTANTYSLQVVGTDGSLSRTASFSLTVTSAGSPAPVITSHPQNQTVLEGGSASFSVQASGSGLSYQWFKNASPIVGSSSASYTTLPLSSTDQEAEFYVGVSNSGGRVVSLSAKVSLLSTSKAPTITQRPYSQSVLAGQTATFSVIAQGSGSLTYQWFKNGSAISGATNAIYTTPILSSNDDWSNFMVTVKNSLGTTNSPEARLRVLSGSVKPIINDFWANPVEITAGASSTLSWLVLGANSLSLDNGIGNVTGTSISVKPTVTTPYRLTATNATGSVTSQVTVIVDEGTPRPTIHGFTASSLHFVPGDDITLNWSVSRAKSLFIDPGIGAVTGSSVTVKPTATTTYTLSAANEAGSVSASLQIQQATVLKNGTLGSSGGTLTDGNVTLTIPAGALSQNADLQLLSIPVPSDQMATAISGGYQLRGFPDSVAKPLTLSLPLTGTVSGTPVIVLRDESAFSKSAGLPSTQDRILPAQVQGNKLVVEIQLQDGNQVAAQSEVAQAFSRKGSTWNTFDEPSLQQTAYEPNRFSFWSLGGLRNMSSDGGHFTIYYPDVAVTAKCTHIELASDLEKAYGILTGYGLQASSTRDWPLEVSIRAMANEAETSLTFPGYYIQQEFSYASLNGDCETLAATAGHELFHVFQVYYDPRTRISQRRGPSDQYWLDEAVATWFQEKMVSKPTSYTPEDFVANPVEPFLGLRNRMREATHGYGSAPIIKFLVQNHPQRELALNALYTRIRGGTHPTTALQGVFYETPLSFWYSTFVEQFIGGKVYKFDNRVLFTGQNQAIRGRANLNVKREHNFDYDDYWYRTSYSAPPLSTSVFILIPGGVMEDQMWDYLGVSARMANDPNNDYAKVYIFRRDTKTLDGPINHAWGAEIEGGSYNDMVKRGDWIVAFVVNPDDETRQFTFLAQTTWGCLPAGTPVRMAEGGSCPIESLQAGDRILAFDPKTQEAVPAQVRKSLIHDQGSFSLLRMSTETGLDLCMTEKHPVLRQDGEWVPAHQIQPGDRIFALHPSTGCAQPVSVLSVIRESSKEGVVYNLKTTLGNYFASDILVHNKCLAQGSLIDTPFGLRPVESLKMGDTVLGVQNGQTISTRITHVYQKETVLAALPGIRLANGMIVTENHLLWDGSGFRKVGEFVSHPTEIRGPVYDLRTECGNYLAGGILMACGD